MKQTTLHLFTLLILALTTLSTTAHDFEADGIYYNINGTEATVTYQGSSYGQYINEYTGDVTIPETVTYGATTYSVTSIDHYAFYECPDLTSINIPNSVIGIGNYAFYNCTGLESAIIPNSVIGIGRNAFVSCGRLENIILGSSLSFIDESAFFHCDNLASITSFSSEPPYIYEPVFPIDALLSANLHLPMKSISAYKHAEYWEDFSNIVEIIFEIDGIWYCALTDNTAMVIQRPEEDNSYHGDVVIPDSVSYLGFTFTVTAIDASAFEDCYDLTSIVIGDAVETIGENAFQGCTGLTSITLGHSVSAIGYGAFRNCSGLTNITIPNSVSAIGYEVFRNCSGLTNITIPNSVTSIGDRAFAGCSGLTSMKVENGNPKFDSRNNCNAIIETATNTLFAGCKNTTIPNSVTTIGLGAFSGCSGLTSINIPNSITFIDWDAFLGCSGLTSINIPNSVTSIGWHTFDGCSGLTSITIPNSITDIDGGAFHH